MTFFRFIVLILAMLLSSVFSMGAQSPRDSLLLELASAPHDTSRVWMYRDIAYYFQSESADSVLKYSTLGYELARDLAFAEGQIWSLYQTALCYELSDRFEEAVETYELALAIARKSGRSLSESKLLNAVGVAYYYAGDYHQALKHYSRAYSLADSMAYEEGRAHALNNLGVIYRVQRRFDKALEIYQKSLEIKFVSADTAGIINSLHNIGLAYAYLNRYEDSLDEFMRAMRLAEQFDPGASDVANIQSGIGVALYNLGRIDECKPYLIRAAEGSGTRSSRESVVSLAYLGVIEALEGDPINGLESIESAMLLAEQSGHRQLLRSILKEHAIAAQRAGYSEKAAQSWQRYIGINDSLNTEAGRWAQEELQARFELKEKEVTIAQQNLTIEQETAKRKRHVIIAFSLLLLLTLSAIFGYWIWRQKERLKQEMKLKQEALEENEWLFKELQHRTRNNLQLLGSLLSLQGRNSTSDEVKQALGAGRDTVDALGLLHKHLYLANNRRQVDIKTYLGELISYFMQAYRLSERNIAFIVHCDPIFMDADRAISLGLVINELVTNAIKHAFLDRDSGTIELQLRKDDHSLLLTVEDNGKGKSMGSTMGTGSTMLELFARKLNAQFYYEDQNSGTKAIFEIREE